MGGCERWHRAYGGTKLRYCTVEVPNAQQPAPRVGSESGCLLVRLSLTDFGPGFRFGGCTSGITELAKNRSQRSVGTGEVGLQASLQQNMLEHDARLGGFALHRRACADCGREIRQLGKRIRTEPDIVRCACKSQSQEE